MTPPETETEVKKDTITINVDGHDVEANPGELVIAAAERNGTYIPRFCYHSRMEPVGMCRMCLVNVEGPRGTSMQVSCMLTATEGMKVDTQSPEVKKAQDGVLEFLLINHPLDCPVCDKGGECPLQDQTLAFGPGETRFIEEKRHFEKPIKISPLVELDRERCILCDRCTRFSADVAGDPLIHFQERGNNTQVNTFPDHPFASYFSGNTVQICPVGALTAEPYRFKARPWDLEQVESTCTSCSFGCRTAVQSSGDTLTRYLGIDAEPTNHGWMCDKGRFDFEALNSQERLASPRLKVDGELVDVSWGEALEAAAAAIKAASADKVAVIGGSRLANEDQYAWAKLAKSVIGTDHVDAQLGDGLPAEAVLGVPRATIDDACNAKAVVLMAPDIKEELPVLFLRLRDAVKAKGLQVIEIAPQPTSFSNLAAHSLMYRAGDAAAVVGALLGKGAPEAGGVLAQDIAAARETLINAGDVVVIAGRQSVAESSKAITDAIGLFAQHSNARFLSALRRSNVMGALDMGLAPGVLPGRVALKEGSSYYTEAWGNVPAKAGLDTGGILTAAAAGDIDVLVLLGADPLKDFPDRELAQEAISQIPTVIAVDILPNKSVLEADIVLAAASYAERGGTTTNIEGRITKLGQKTTAPGVAWPDWMIASELAHHLESQLGFDDITSIWDEIERTLPTHRGITTTALNDKQYEDGIVAPTSTIIIEEDDLTPPQPVSRANVPPTMSYKTGEAAVPKPIEGSVRLVASRKLYDTGTLVQHSPHLAGLISEQHMRVHPSTVSSLNIETGGSVKVKNSRGEFTTSIVIDERVPKGVGVLTFNTSEDGVSSLIDASQLVTNVKLESA